MNRIMLLVSTVLLTTSCTTAQQMHDNAVNEALLLCADIPEETEKWEQCISQVYQASYAQQNEGRNQATAQWAAALGNAAGSYQHQQQIYKDRYNSGTQCMTTYDGYGHAYTQCR